MTIFNGVMLQKVQFLFIFMTEIKCFSKVSSVTEVAPNRASGPGVHRGRFYLGHIVKMYTSFPHQLSLPVQILQLE